MAITTCKECGGKVSTKADACPSCGAKLKSAPGGCAQALGGLIALAILLFFVVVVIGALSSSSERDPQQMLAELEAKCAASAKEAPATMGKKEFYEACIAGGRAQLRADNVIK